MYALILALPGNNLCEIAHSLCRWNPTVNHFCEPVHTLCASALELSNPIKPSLYSYNAANALS